MSESVKLPIGSRVRFTGRFSLAGKPFDQDGISAVVREGTVPQTFTTKNGLMQLAAGVYFVDVDLNRAGPVTVRFVTADGYSEKQEYEVVADVNAAMRAAAAAAAAGGKEQAAPVAAEPRADGGGRRVAWPAGYDRARAVAELRFDCTGKSDAHVLGALQQHQKHEQLAGLLRHDDATALPDASLEARAQDLAKSAVREHERHPFKLGDPTFGTKAIREARRNVRLALLSGR